MNPTKPHLRSPGLMLPLNLRIGEQLNRKVHKLWPHKGSFPNYCSGQSSRFTKTRRRRSFDRSEEPTKQTPWRSATRFLQSRLAQVAESFRNFRTVATCSFARSVSLD